MFGRRVREKKGEKIGKRGLLCTPSPPPDLPPCMNPTRPPPRPAALPTLRRPSVRRPTMPLTVAAALPPALGDWRVAVGAAVGAALLARLVRFVR